MKTWRLLSPPGLAAVAIIGVTGDLQGLDLRDARERRTAWPGAGSIGLRRLGRGAGVVDEALVVGTDGGAELHVHGGAGTLEAVIAWLEGGGFRRAEAEAETAPASLRHARALLSARCGPLAALRRHALPSERGAVGRVELPAEVQADLDRCLQHAEFAGRLARVPVVALVGLPNAGKSTLFNALVGHARALVDSQTGTTRDTVGARILLRGAAVDIHDTAGEDPVAATTSPADLVVHLLSEPGEWSWPERSSQRILRVLGQADRRPMCRTRAVSGLTGAGLPALLEDMADALGIASAPEADLWAPADPSLAVWLVETDAVHEGPSSRGDSAQGAR